MLEAAGTGEKNHAKFLRNSRELVEAAGVELKGSELVNTLMWRDFWCKPVDVVMLVTTSRLYSGLRESTRIDLVRGGILEAAGHRSRRPLAAPPPRRV